MRSSRICISLVCFAFLTFCVSNVCAQNNSDATTLAPGPSLSADAKKKCTAQMLSWCKANQKFAKQMGMATVSVSYNDGETLVFCNVDANVTECKANMEPWFECFSNNTLTYKGQVLNDSSFPVDDEICVTEETASKFGKQLGFNQTELDTDLKRFMIDMEDFRQEFRNLQQMLQQIQERIKGNDTNISDIETTVDEVIPSDNSTRDTNEPLNSSDK